MFFSLAILAVDILVTFKAEPKVSSSFKFLKNMFYVEREFTIFFFS